MKEETAPMQTTDPHPWYRGGCDALGPNGTCAECAKLAPPQITEIPVAEQLLDALVLCLPIMESEYSDYGPREPETRALNAARAAVERAMQNV